jgi:hypothetical protein
MKSPHGARYVAPLLSLLGLVGLLASCASGGAPAATEAAAAPAAEPTGPVIKVQTGLGWPATALAAATAGLARYTSDLVLPMRPTKLRLVVEMQRSPAASTPM